MKTKLGFEAVHREVTEVTGKYPLREQSEAYGANFTGESEVLRVENTIFWDENAETAEIEPGPTPHSFYFRVRYGALLVLNAQFHELSS